MATSVSRIHYEEFGIKFHVVYTSHTGSALAGFVEAKETDCRATPSEAGGTCRVSCVLFIKLKPIE